MSSFAYNNRDEEKDRVVKKDRDGEEEVVDLDAVWESRKSESEGYDLGSLPSFTNEEMDNKGNLSNAFMETLTKPKLRRETAFSLAPNDSGALNKLLGSNNAGQNRGGRRSTRRNSKRRHSKRGHSSRRRRHSRRRHRM